MEKSSDRTIWVIAMLIFFAVLVAVGRDNIVNILKIATDQTTSIGGRALAELPRTL